MEHETARERIIEARDNPFIRHRWRTGEFPRERFLEMADEWIGTAGEVEKKNHRRIEIAAFLRCMDEAVPSRYTFELDEDQTASVKSRARYMRYNLDAFGLRD